MINWTVEGSLDRVEVARSDPAWVEAAWCDPRARVIAVADGAVAAGAVQGLAWSECSGGYDPERHHLLGLVAQAPRFAVLGGDGLTNMRTIMDTLPAAELECAFTALGLVGWHQRARFCGSCGARTEVIRGGQARRCPACAQESYPRTDPAVIVAIVDEAGRLLLGRQPSWAPGRYSVFAGFVEMAESLEQAVRREMAEEVGLDLDTVSYLGSQPWPFPRSLMVGFLARAPRTQVKRADAEIEDARWFTVDDLRAAITSGRLSLPPHTSIARRMIESWLAGELA